MRNRRRNYINSTNNNNYSNVNIGSGNNKPCK